MKKFLLFATAAMAVMPLAAQENLIVNGGFEDGAILNDQDSWACDDKTDAIDGWLFKGNKWNTRGLVLAYGADAATPENAGLQYCRIERNNNGGWYQAENLMQVVELPIESNQYVLSFDIRTAMMESRSNTDVNFFIKVYTTEFDDGNLEQGAEPVWEWSKTWTNGEETWDFTDWERMETPVINTGASSYVRINFGVNGAGGNDAEGGTGDNKVYMELDNVSFVSASEGAVNEIAAGNVVNVKYYGIDGVEVLSPAHGQLVIEKATLENGAVKVAKKVVR